MKEKREIKNKDEIKLIFITKYDVFRKVFYAKTNGYGFNYKSIETIHLVQQHHPSILKWELLFILSWKLSTLHAAYTYE